MKKTVTLPLIRSFIVLVSCLALSQAAQAKPGFHGTLSMTYGGMVMIGGGDDLGSAANVMLMGMGSMGSDTVTHSDGDFAVLRVKRGDLVNGDMMLMEGMSMEAELSIPSLGWSWTESDTGPTFSSTGPDNLRITVAGMTKGGGYAPTAATLTLDFFIDENGMLENSITLTAEPPGQQH